MTTDLERVREVLLTAKATLKADGFQTTLFVDDACAIIDAHLKEDAEKHEAAMLFAEQRDKARAELAELREENVRLKNFGLTYSDVDEARAAELAELREDRDRLKSSLLALDTAAVKRYDELREAVRAHLDDPLLRHTRSLRQLIEEKE